jgi:putative ABC transport system substrate-binding protein
MSPFDPSRTLAPILTYRIGVLWHAASAEEEAVYLGALRERLADFGYVEVQNVILENRFPAEKWNDSLASQPN